MANSNHKPGPCKPHVVAVPLVAQGHLIPFLELAKLLALQGLIVSYITTPGNVARLQPQVDKFKSSNPDADIRLVSLTMPPIEGVPPGIESSDNLPSHIVTILMTSSHKLAGPFEEWLQAQMSNAANDYPPVCIISDIFTGWVHHSGAKFGVPTVVFHTSGAFAMSLMHSVVTYTPQKNVQGDEDYFEVPKLTFDFKLRRADMPVDLRDPDSNTMQNFVKEEINQSMEGQGVIFNTFYELESVGIDHIKSLTGKPVWSIGPILPPSIFEADGTVRALTGYSRGKDADISEAECLEWLDSRRPNSVVFVCFGSQISMNPEQIRSLAGGLESSGQAFVWAIRRIQGSESDATGLPEGFEERTRDRGLVIWGWAPQLLILSHPCVGAFLSHCGWNSTLESVSLGVPMITWPMFAEQPFNSKLLVEHLRIAEQICVDIRSVPDEEVVKKVVIKLLAVEEGNNMRMRAEELRKKAKMAVGKGGSSYTSLQAFLAYMRELHLNWVVSHCKDEKGNKSVWKRVCPIL